MGIADWFDLGHPVGGLSAVTMGVTTADNEPYVFVLGDDGNLWVNWLSS